MCWNSHQGHYILPHHGHHLHRIQIRNLFRLQMQDFCRFDFTLDWSILWRFRSNIRLNNDEIQMSQGKGQNNLWPRKNVCPWDNNTYRTMYRMYLGQAQGKNCIFLVIYLHWKNLSHLESLSEVSCVMLFKELSYLCFRSCPTTERMCLH